MEKTSENPHSSHRNQNIGSQVGCLKEEKQKAFPDLAQEKIIFSFKYSIWRVLWRVGTTCLAILVFYIIVFGKSKKDDGLFWFFFNQIFGGLGLQICILMLLDTIFTKEIILYPQKISKKWCFGFCRDVDLASARFGAMKTAFFSTKRFYPSWCNNAFTLIIGVLYDETLARKKDILLMNKYLAEISGRDLSVFESGVVLTSRSVSLKSFMKEKHTHEW